MFEVIIIVRELGRLKPDYSLNFSLPALPREGDYISITRPDTPKPWSEDLIVRKVWWNLHHPETAGVAEDVKVGKLTEIFIECDAAEGPYASDHWRKMLGGAASRGVDVPTFEVERVVLR